MCFKSRNMPYLQCLGTDFYMLSIISYISTGAKRTLLLPSNKDSSWAVTVQCHRLICCFVNWLLINHRHLTLMASFDWPFYTQWSEGQRCRGRIYETINHVSCMDLLSHCQHQIHYPNTHDTCNLPRQRYSILYISMQLFGTNLPAAWRTSWTRFQQYWPFPRDWPFVRWIHLSAGLPSQRASNAGFDVFFDVGLNKQPKQTDESLVIWDARMLIVTSLWCHGSAWPCWDFLANVKA